MEIEPFSPAEIATLRNTEFFRLKAAAALRIRASFEGLRAAIHPLLGPEGWLCEAEVEIEHAFLTAGEDYLELPYVVMDYPKHYSRREKLAMRTLFWWGHYVVYSLILEGPWLPAAVGRTEARLGGLERAEVHASTAPTPWDWRRGDGYTRPLRDDEETRIWLGRQSFLKLMRFLPVDDARFGPEGIVTIGRDSWMLFAPIVREGGPD